jgi:hypothetical protein
MLHFFGDHLDHSMTRFAVLIKGSSGMGPRLPLSQRFLQMCA